MTKQYAIICHTAREQQYGLFFPNGPGIKNCQRYEKQQSDAAVAYANIGETAAQNDTAQCYCTDTAVKDRLRGRIQNRQDTCQKQIFSAEQYTHAV